jgi:hypothetical protein
MAGSGGEIEAVVTGGSMGSSIPSGSRIRMRPVGSEAPAIQVGSVVVHHAVNGLLVAHRVVAVGSNRRQVPFVITQGDCQTLCDMPVDVADLRGMVTAVCREGTWEAPPPRPASRGFAALAIGGGTLGVVRFWAWATGASQREWISRKLLRLRRL